MTPAALAVVAERAASLGGPDGFMRPGQAAYTALYEVAPTLAESLAGGPNDPYHDDTRLPLFWAFVVESALEVPEDEL